MDINEENYLYSLDNFVIMIIPQIHGMVDIFRLDDTIQ